MFYQVTATAGLRFSTRIWRQLVSSIAQIKLSEIQHFLVPHSIAKAELEKPRITMGLNGVFAMQTGHTFDTQMKNYG